MHSIDWSKDDESLAVTVSISRKTRSRYEIRYQLLKSKES